MRRRRLAGWDYPLFAFGIEQNEPKQNSMLKTLGGKAVDMSIENDSVYFIGANGNKACIDKSSLLLIFNAVLEDADDADDYWD